MDAPNTYTEERVMWSCFAQRIQSRQTLLFLFIATTVSSSGTVSAQLIQPAEPQQMLRGVQDAQLQNSFEPGPLRPELLQPTATLPPGYDQQGYVQSEEQGAKKTDSAEVANNRELDEDYVSDEEFESARKDTVARNLEYGERSVPNTQNFLRTQTPLLKRGQVQWDLGLQYSVFEADFPTLFGATLTEANVTSRTVESTIGMRYGVNDRLQLFANTTLGWQQTSFFDGFSTVNEDSGGIGDTNLGLNFLLRPESENCPSIILSSDVTVPTGNASDPLFLTDAGIGSGPWATSSRFLMVRSIDPVLLFWGAGYRHTFEATYRTNQVDLGNQFFYNLGIGFAANERVTLSAAYNGSFVTDLEVNGVDLDGSSFDLGSIRLAATVLRCSRIYEPFITFGMTDRTPSSVFGVVLTR